MHDRLKTLLESTITLIEIADEGGVYDEDRETAHLAIQMLKTEILSASVFMTERHIVSSALTIDAAIAFDMFMKQIAFPIGARWPWTVGQVNSVATQYIGASKVSVDEALRILGLTDGESIDIVYGS